MKRIVLAALAFIAVKVTAHARAPTDPQRGFEPMFRLYAPTDALFDKTRKLTDTNMVAAQ